MRASGGNRVEWAEIPVEVRAAIEASLGGRVAVAENQAGGFSPGLAARCRLDTGERVFIKAVSPAQNPLATRIHRREVEVASALPALAGSPRLRNVHDDGTWVALVFDDVDGRQPAEPWTCDDLDVVMPAIARLHESVTPTPVPDLQTVQARHRPVFDGWRRFAGGDGDVDRLDPWARARIDRLAEIEAGWEDAADGDTMLHADLRADNMLIDGDGRVWFVDWPWACAGAAFVDLVFLLPSIGLGGGPSPASVIERYGLFADVDPDAVRAVAVAVTGFFRRSALDEPPPGLPTVRDFQRAQGDVAVGWLRAMGLQGSAVISDVGSEATGERGIRR